MAAMSRIPIPLTALLILTACGSAEQTSAPVQRFSFDDAAQATDAVLTSPDTTDAVWTVSESGQAVVFAKAGAPPLLTLACRLKESPAQLAVIRHVQSRPGLSALFPVIGNGTISRFQLDATLSGSEWRWEGALPASDPLNDVFTGTRELEATLPGGGSLLIGPSRIPGEFVNWCRAGGRLQRVQEPVIAATEAATPAPATSPSPAR